jgi:hypothetical protein
MGRESGRRDVRGCSQTKDEWAVNLREHLSERVFPKESRIIAGEVSHG